MSSKLLDMQTTFEKLSEKNQDIMILIAKTIRVTQDAAKERTQQPNRV